jgi:hypothetical protein
MIKTETFKSYNEEKSIILIFDTDMPELLGFTICKTKKLKKFLNFDHLLFNKSEIINKIIPVFNRKNGRSSFAECECKSEILRINYNKDYNIFYLDIFDNYFLKSKKGISDNIELTYDEAMKLQRTLIVYANTEMRS